MSALYCAVCVYTVRQGVIEQAETLIGGLALCRKHFGHGQTVANTFSPRIEWNDDEPQSQTVTVTRGDV